LACGRAWPGQTCALAKNKAPNFRSLHEAKELFLLPVAAMNFQLVFMTPSCLLNVPYSVQYEDILSFCRSRYLLCVFVSSIKNSYNSISSNRFRIFFTP